MTKPARIIFVFVLTLVFLASCFFILHSSFLSAPARAESASQGFCPTQGSGFLPSAPFQGYQVSPNLAMQWGHPPHAFEEIGQRNYSFIINQPFTYELTPDNIAAIKSVSPETKILRYRSGVEVFNSTVHNDTVWGDNFMRRQNSEEEWLDVWNNHQNWLTKDIDGDYVTRIDGPHLVETISGENAYLLDISNGEVKEWLFQWMKNTLLDSEFDGMFLDLIPPYYPSHVWGKRPAVGGNPITDRQWRDMVLGYMSYLKGRQSETPGLADKVFIFNGLDNGQVFKNHNGMEFLENSPFDGAQIEGFIRWQNNPADYYKSEEEWKNDVNALRQATTQEPEKSILVSVKNGIEEDFDRHASYYLYSYASFLLGYNSNNASFLYRGRYFPPLGQHWLPYIKSQTIDLGEPVGQYGYNSNYNIYHRDFENGKVFVNPKETSATVVIGNDYLDLLANTTYREGDVIEIPSHTATILIYGRECLPGDADEDGVVDEADLELLKQDYLGEPVHNTDFNSDGRVDCEDFAVLQKNYSP